MPQKIAIVLLNDAISIVGGSITAFYNIINILAKNNTVSAFYYSKNTNTQTKVLDNNTTLTNLYNPENKDLKTCFKSEIEKIKPDILIFFYPRDVKKLMNAGDFKNIKKILLNRSRPDFFNNDYSKIKDIIKDFDALQVFFDSYKSLCAPFYKGKIVTIENSIALRKIKADLTREKKNIIYLSRIDMWKGADILIEAFKEVALKYPDWKVQIYGKTEPKKFAKFLNNLVKKYNLEKNIFFMGVTKDIESAFLSADFCVFPSYFEGFPNGLVEAQSYGLPSVGLKGCSGVNELIIDGYNGLLAEDNPQALACAICSLIENKEKRLAMGANTLQNNTKYSQGIIEQKWEKLIEATAKNDINEQSLMTNTADSKIHIYPIEKIWEMKFQKNVLSFRKRFFSINFTPEKIIICVLGLIIKIKK